MMRMCATERGEIAHDWIFCSARVTFDDPICGERRRPFFLRQKRLWRNLHNPSLQNPPVRKNRTIIPTTRLSLSGFFSVDWAEEHAQSRQGAARRSARGAAAAGAESRTMVRLGSRSERTWVHRLSARGIALEVSPWGRRRHMRVFRAVPRVGRARARAWAGEGGGQRRSDERDSSQRRESGANRQKLSPFLPKKTLTYITTDS